MNVRVEAGPLTINVVAIVGDVVVSTEFNVFSSHAAVLDWACFSLAPISINGHSLNAINPDFAKAGELTTSDLA